jgi:hypothetical protein
MQPSAVAPAAAAHDVIYEPEHQAADWSGFVAKVCKQHIDTQHRAQLIANSTDSSCVSNIYNLNAYRGLLAGGTILSLQLTQRTSSGMHLFIYLFGTVLKPAWTALTCLSEPRIAAGT